MSTRISITPGDRFGRLIVVRQIACGPIRWECECDCGRVKIVNSSNLKKTTRSCGCLWAEMFTSHGMSYSPEYVAWTSMKTRCLNATHWSYKNWGGKGVTVYGPWVKSFQLFFNDVGPRPSSAYSLDRIDNNKGYEPGNVRWATRSEQNRNTSKSIYLVLDGERLHINDWAERLGVKVSMIYARIKRYKWSDRDVLLTPAGRRPTSENRT